MRSSGIGEDSAGASFAGQHATVLGVRSIDGVLAAMREVHASARTDAALGYRRKLGLDPEPRTDAARRFVGARGSREEGPEPIDPSQEALQRAQEIAGRHENQQVEPIHLLAALATARAAAAPPCDERPDSLLLPAAVRSPRDQKLRADL